MTKKKQKGKVYNVKFMKENILQGLNRRANVKIFEHRGKKKHKSYFLSLKIVKLVYAFLTRRKANETTNVLTFKK